MKFPSKVRNLTPVFIENSKLPLWLSKIAPINIHAFSFLWLVFGKGTLSKTTRRHETIHFQQQLELLFVFQWLLYVSFWIVGLIKYRSGKEAYHRNPFEQEAYDNARKPTYLGKRELWSWRKYKI